MIEDFMQNAQVLINNHYDLQTIMLTIISKLSLVTQHEFGPRCFQSLKDLMIAGKEMQEKVTEVIRTEVVQGRMNGVRGEKTVPPQLIWGLHELVGETKKSEILNGLYDQFFP
jgi:hypothetical protein